MCHSLMPQTSPTCVISSLSVIVDNAEGGPLLPDNSFNNDVVGDRNIVEEVDDEITGRNKVVLVSVPLLR